ncbi:MAG: RyR domain-containing protein [Nitrosopumilaceae archaeon]|nr:RyR domain-containing protein [Nitrosopumilaceae archaeon]
MQTININAVARMCHQTNKAWCEIHGDNSQVEWNEAPDNIKQSAIDGVRHIINNPLSTPQESHMSWLNYKVKDGWVYGKIKDIEKKTHPCMVPYHELPLKDQVKDELFGSVVRAFMHNYTIVG